MDFSFYSVFTSGSSPVSLPFLIILLKSASSQGFWTLLSTGLTHEPAPRHGGGGTCKLHTVGSRVGFKPATVPLPGQSAGPQGNIKGKRRFLIRSSPVRDLTQSPCLPLDTLHSLLTTTWPVSGALMKTQALQTAGVCADAAVEDVGQG